MVLKAGEPAYHDTTGLFKLGDGVTALSALSFLPIVSSSTPTLQQVLTTGNVATTTIETTGFIKTGGTSSQFLKADGTVDSNVYGVGNALTTNPLSQFAATTSSQLAGVISDETGTGALVFGTSPTFTTSAIISGGTATIKLQNYFGSTTDAAIYFNQGTPSGSNYGIYATALRTDLNATTSVNLTIAGSTHLGLSSTLLSLGNGVSRQISIAAQSISGASTIGFQVTNPSHTNILVGTNLPSFRSLGSTQQWATGALATQYFNHFTANTVSFVGASTATNVYNLFVEAPIQGTNATITNNYAAGFGGNVHAIVGTSTNGLKFQGWTSDTTIPAVYNQATPSAANYSLLFEPTNSYINGTSTVHTRINNASVLTVSATQLLLASGINIATNTTTGTKIGTATTQKISFWNATPIVQPTTAVAAATFVQNTGGTIHPTSTFDGYTIEQVVRALRTIGLLA
jgi:hypothetical protein